MASSWSRGRAVTVMTSSKRVEGPVDWAAAAATAASAILSKPDSLRMTLSYLQQMQGVHGAVVVRGERIGVAGNLELAA